MSAINIRRFLKIRIVDQNFIDVRPRKINYITDSALRRQSSQTMVSALYREFAIHTREYGLVLHATMLTSYVLPLRKVPC